MKRAREMAKKSKERGAEMRAEGKAAYAQATSGHYEATVNKGSVSMTQLSATLNKRWGAGWELAHIFEQAGNTVTIWERRDVVGDTEN